MSTHDYVYLLITVAPALITAIAGLVTAVGTLVWTWRQEKKISEVSTDVREHLRVCPNRDSQPPQ